MIFLYFLELLKKMLTAFEINHKLKQCYEDFGRISIGPYRKKKVEVETFDYIKEKIEIFELDLKKVEDEMYSLKNKLKPKWFRISKS